jgi:hypothetical protein
MLHCEARRTARRDRDGRYVPLSEQDPKQWSLSLIEEAERHLAEASKHGSSGRFQLEAAIQSVHAERARSGRIEWAAIAFTRLVVPEGSSISTVSPSSTRKRSTAHVGLLSPRRIMYIRKRPAQPFPATRAPKSPTTQRGHLLKLHRLHEGLYARIARRNGVHATYVSRVAGGERRSMKIRTSLLADLASIEKQREQIAP